MANYKEIESLNNRINELINKLHKLKEDKAIKLSELDDKIKSLHLSNSYIYESARKSIESDYQGKLDTINEDYIKLKEHVEEVYNHYHKTILNIVSCYTKLINPDYYKGTDYSKIRDEDLLDYLVKTSKEVEKIIKESKSIYSYNDEKMNALTDFMHNLSHFNASFDRIMHNVYHYKEMRKETLNEMKKEKETSNKKSYDSGYSKEKEIIDHKNETENYYNQEIASKEEELYKELDQIEKLVDECNEKNALDATYLGFNKDIHIENEFKNELNILLGVNVATKQYEYHYDGKKHHYQINSQEPYSIDMMFNFVDYQNNAVLITYNENLSDNQKELLVSSILLRLLVSYKENYKRFVFSADDISNSILFKPSIRLSNKLSEDKNAKNDNVYYNKDSKIYGLGDGYSNPLKTVLEEALSINSGKAISKSDSVIKYNTEVPSSSAANLVYVIHDSGEKELDKSNLTAFLGDPRYKQCGIFFFIFATRDNAPKFEKYCPYRFELLHGYGDNHIILETKNHMLIDLNSSAELNTVYETIGYVNSLLDKEFEFFTFDEMLQNINKEKINSKKDLGLFIPIGIEKGEICTLKLTVKGEEGSPHLRVRGDSGFGKSIFLTSLILSATSLYSPEELEINIIDLKKGTQFNAFGSLAHISKMAMESNILDINEMFKSILKEQERRKTLFKSLEEKEGIAIQDIVDYNKAVEKYNASHKDNKIARMPFLLVIADEFNRIADDYESFMALKSLIQDGRSFGILLVLSSSISIKDRDIEDKITQTVDFYNKEIAESKRLGNKSLNADELDFISKKGHSILKGADEQLHFALIAFVHNTENMSKIAKINEKYGVKEHKARYLGTVHIKEEKADYKPIENAHLLNEKWIKENANDPSRSLRSLATFVNIGYNIFDEEQYYNIDSNNPVLLLLGSREEACHFEYNLLTYFPFIHKEQTPSLYYINLYKGPDGFEDDLINNLKDELKNNKQLKFYKKDDISDFIHDIYQLYKEREDIDGTCYPVEIVIHYADDLRKALDNGKKSSSGGSFFDDDSSLDEKSLEEMFIELLKDGVNRRIFFVLNYTNSTNIRDYKSNYIPKDFIVLPNSIESTGGSTNDYVLDWIGAVTNNVSVSKYTFLKSHNLMNDEAKCSYLIDDYKPMKLVLRRFKF